MISLDTEDDSCGTVQIINFFDGSCHHTFTGDKLKEQAWGYLHQIAPEKIWACNMEYDLINLFGEWVGKMCTLQYVGSGLLRGSFRDAKVTFLDTLRHWPMSVEQMGNYLGLPKLKKDFSDIKYCQRDTEIVYFFVQEMMKRYDAMDLKPKATLPAMALQLMNGFYPVPRINYHKIILNRIRETYYGGRVEVYRFGEINGETRHYDFNSLFPSVMKTEIFPDPQTWYDTRSPDLDHEGVARVTIKIPETMFPCLPYRTDEGLIFPYGEITGSWVYPELRQAVNDGAEILETFWAVEWKKTCQPFVRFVDHCYQNRMKAKKEGDQLWDLIWKLFMNSLYGKFGQNRPLETIFNDRLIEIKSVSKTANVIWSAYVTAYARLKLLKEIRKCSRIYYTDTDSLFTPDLFKTSTKLGGLKLEGVYKKVDFHGNKIYTLDHVSKAKGVPKDVAADFIRTGRAVYRKPARLRESRRTFATANVWYEVEKRKKKEYTKRIVTDSGLTLPWDYQEYEKIMGVS